MFMVQYLGTTTLTKPNVWENAKKKHLEWKRNHYIKAYVSAADLLANTAHLWTEIM